MEVLTTETPTSWPQRLEKMEIGQEIAADFDKKNTVRNAANKVSLKSGRKFSTEKKNSNGVHILLVRRVE